MPICGAVPEPDEPKLSLSGLRLAKSTSSASVLKGDEAGTTSTAGDANMP